jgi:hypothetical protein
MGDLIDEGTGATIKDWKCAPPSVQGTTPNTGVLDDNQDEAAGRECVTLARRVPRSAIALHAGSEVVSPGILRYRSFFAVRACAAIGNDISKIMGIFEILRRQCP